MGIKTLMAERKRLRRTERMPNGLIYRPEFISGEEEKRLLAAIQQLPFHEALYHEYVAKRRVVQFGLNYSFDSRQATPGDPLPTFLLPFRARIRELVPGVSADDLVEAIATEYAPGAAIGWHRDAPQFGIVFGISLASSCRLRFRLESKDEYEIASLILQPRSAYVFLGEARWRWKHSIPAVEELRYSITFRTLRANTRDASGVRAA